MNDEKVTDHHAIIITGDLNSSLTNDEQVIYDMIVVRFKESFLESSQEEGMTVEFCLDEDHVFVWKGQRTKFLGWKAVQKEDNKEDEQELTIVDTFPKIEEGISYNLIDCQISEHKTKAKPIYTEASLLSAMENAGKEVEDKNSRKAMSDCGIGTPATRASIIETLILRDYITRNKKQLIPTEKGLAVYNIIKDKKIANAEMTGVWELSLSLIETGKLRIEDFEKDIITYTSQICDELLDLDDGSSLNKYTSYTCPKCNQESIAVYSKVASCRNENCDFHIFRHLCGYQLSESNIKDLLEKRKTAMLKGLVSKAGKKFNARLILKEDLTTTLEFDTKNKKK